jgi:hypothetical protein
MPFSSPRSALFPQWVTVNLQALFGSAKKSPADNPGQTYIRSFRFRVYHPDGDCSTLATVPHPNVHLEVNLGKRHAILPKPQHVSPIEYPPRPSDGLATRVPFASAGNARFQFFDRVSF